MLNEPHYNRPQLEPMLPLINIVFLLLIFFLIAGNTQVPIDLSIIPPQKSVEENTLSSHSYEWVYLKKDGRLSYQDKPLHDEDIASLLNHELTLFADGDTPGLIVAETLVRFTKQGIKKISIVSELSDD